MKTLGERWQSLWALLRSGPTRTPARVVLPRERTDSAARLGGAFRRDAEYFQVRVNDMYLPNSREWLSRYDPLVFAVTEFTYDKKAEAVPFVVGPSLLERFGQKIPEGMVFSDTRVAGPYPYRGGRLALSVVLCRVRRGDYARRMLQMVESASGALDLSAALGSYLKVAGVILEGVEAMLGLGDTDALVGARVEFDPDAGDVLQPGYFVLLDLPETAVDPATLWVRDNRLVHGPTLPRAKPFREAGYVMYSLAQAAERTDETTLPFYPLFERVKEEAAMPDQESWKRAKANLLALFQALALSPDLTPGQAKSLGDRFVAEAKALHGQAAGLETLGGGPVASARPTAAARPPEVEARLREAVSILDL